MTLRSTRFRKTLEGLTPAQMDELCDALDAVLPARFRTGSTVTDQPYSRIMPEIRTPHDQMRWVHEMLGKLGVPPRQGFAELRDIMEAARPMTRQDPDAAVRMFRGIREWSPADWARMRAIRDAMDQAGDKSDGGRHFLEWIMKSQFGDPRTRVTLQALTRHVPGFGATPDPDAIRAFRRAYTEAARRPPVTTEDGRAFEAFVAQAMPVATDLNTLARNFDIFDHLLVDPRSGALFSSVAEGGLVYLGSKVHKLFRHGLDAADPQHVAQFNRVVDKLRGAAATGHLPDAAVLAAMTPAEAARQVAQRARLVVPPEMVDPLRAALASRADLERLLAAYRAATGRSDATVDDLLRVVQPAF